MEDMAEHRLLKLLEQSQQLLTPMAVKQKTQPLTFGWSEEEGIELEFVYG